MTSETRFIAALAPGLSAVQVAALREFVIGVGLVALLHFRAQRLLPKRFVGAPRPGNRSSPAFTMKPREHGS